MLFVIQIVSIFVGIVLFALSVVLFVLQSGFRAGKCEVVRAYLSKTTSEKNVYKGGKYNKKLYKHYTNCVYVYRVNGVPYEIREGFSVTKNNVPFSIMVTYQKKHPKIAYTYTKYFFLILGIFAFFLSTVFLCLGIFVA